MDWIASGLPYSKDAFQELVLQKGCELYRSLPWRNINNPYAVYVSEVMLQQTQVSRVLNRWPLFVERFPSLDALACASTADVLDAWQGLGYNRRGLALKATADYCCEHLDGNLPTTAEELTKLPGIGPATAAGIVAFAYDKPALYLETNVRTVFLHELFPGQEAVHDKELAPYVADSCWEESPRRWYYALLDYGAHLKKELPNPSRRSAHYTKQSRFEGSVRQKRAELVRIVLAHPGIALDEAKAALDAFELKSKRGEIDEESFEQLVQQLEKEGFFTRKDTCLIP